MLGEAEEDQFPIMSPATHQGAPSLSVIMPVWNGERHIGEAIRSILNQSETDFEFIIIDDGSTDRTVPIIEGFNDPRIRLIRQEHEGIVVHRRVPRGMDRPHGCG
jgi:O-antigen biosynthesis protein